MANITRIKASDTRKRHDLDDVAEAEVVTKVKAATKAKAKAEAKTTTEPKKQVAEKSAPQRATEQATQKASVAKNNDKKDVDNEKTGDNEKVGNSKKVSDNKKADKKHKTPKFIRVITKPFRAFGRYLRDSWGELRQVRWPSRKATWKLTLAVIVYCGILIAIIMGLDLLFTELFGWILG